jgi:putative transposase
VIAFISEHKDHSVPGPDGGTGLRWGVEPMCHVLSQHGIEISPSTYYEWIAKTPTKRQLADEQIVADRRAARRQSHRQVRPHARQQEDVDPTARPGPRRRPLHRRADHA